MMFAMTPTPAWLRQAADAMTRGPTESDLHAANARVAALRAANAGRTDDELVRIAIARATTTSAAVGAAGAGGALVPGIGTLAALTVGAAAELGTIGRVHTRLVLDIAALRGVALTSDDARRAVMVVAGISAAGSAAGTAAGAAALTRAGRMAARRWGERVGKRTILRAVPIVGLVAACGASALATRVIGHRANAFFALGPDAVGDWRASLRAVTGLDERPLLRALRTRRSGARPSGAGA
jgi:hypothetical protein